MVLALGAAPAVQLLIQAAAILGAATIRHIPDAFRGLGLIRTSKVLG
jgi:ribose transport system permease protein